MSQMETFNSDVYPQTLTKQAFKNETDVNKLMARVAKGQTISHLARYGAMYGDFSDIGDLMTAQQRLAKAQEIFDQLPGEVRREFDQSPVQFFNYVNSVDDITLLQTLPGLAKPGTQFPDVIRNRENQIAAECREQEAANLASPSAPQPTSETAPGTLT